MADIDRPLTQTGRNDAEKMGKRLAASGICPDLIFASPARRAFATAEILARDSGYPQENIVVNDNIYGAMPDELLNIIRSSDNSCHTVCLVGHNPETTLLAAYFGALAVNNLPTGGIVALEFEVSTWDKIDRRNCSLLFFDYPDREDSKKVP